MYAKVRKEVDFEVLSGRATVTQRGTEQEERGRQEGQKEGDRSKILVHIYNLSLR